MADVAEDMMFRPEGELPCLETGSDDRAGRAAAGSKRHQKRQAEENSYAILREPWHKNRLSLQIEWAVDAHGQLRVIIIHDFGRFDIRCLDIRRAMAPESVGFFVKFYRTIQDSPSL